MLTCKEFLNWLNEYLDDTAVDEIRQKVDAHVSACPNCFVIFDTTKKTLQVYKGMEPKQLPSDVHDRLMAALEMRLSKSN